MTDFLKTSCSFEQRPSLSQVPGIKFIKTVAQFPNHYISKVVYKWLKPESSISLVDDLEDLKQARLPVADSKYDSCYPHQKVSVNFIKSKDAVLICDEPGAGKTMPVLMSIDGPTLIVAPSSLLKSAWKDQADQFRPDLKTVIVRGTKAQRIKQLEEDADVYIISYQSARAHSNIKGYGNVRLTPTDREKGLLNKQWNMIVADECHRVKNPKTKTCRMMWALAETADKRVGITGTPVSNKPIDIWAVYRFLDPTLWTSSSRFIDLFLEVKVLRFGLREVRDVGRVFPDMQPLFDRVLNFYMLRRTLDEVADPPEVVRQTRTCQLTAAQRRQYKELADKSVLRDGNDFVVIADPLVKDMRLRQVSQGLVKLVPDDSCEQGFCVEITGLSDKPALLADTLNDVDGQVVVFTSSKQLGYNAYNYLLNEGVDVRFVSGDSSAEFGEQAVSDFEGAGFRVLIATLGCLSEGVTLSAAHTLIFLQRSFSFVESVQAEARIRRLTSTSSVVRVIDLVCEGTVDELPASVFGVKGEMFKAVIEDPVARLDYMFGVG